MEKELYEGKQLATRDGRKVGNGIIVEILKDEYTVVTDFGTRITFNEKELYKLFYTGYYVPQESVFQKVKNWNERRRTRQDLEYNY